MMEPVTVHSEREWLLVGMAERCASRGYEATAPQAGWAANLRDGAAALLRLLAGRPTFAHVLLIEAPGAGGRAASLAEAARAELLGFLERGSEQAAEEIPASAPRGTLAGTEALVIGQRISGQTENLTGATPDIVYVLAVPFLGIGEASRLANSVKRRGHLRAVA